MSETALLAGTRKGLWIGRSDAARRRWQWSDPEFLTQGVDGLPDVLSIRAAVV